MPSFLQDVRHAARQLWRRPGFACTAVLTLAIGIGVNAVAFTVVNGVLFRGSAVSAGGDVGRILMTPGGDEEGNGSLEEYRRFAAATARVLEVAAEGRLSVGWRHDSTTETAYALFVSPNYFSMVSAQPIAGRIEVAPSADGPPSVVIGERFWRRKLNAASPSGLMLRLNGVDVAVAGVLPDAFTGPAGLYSPDVWLPLDALDTFHTSPALLSRETRWLFVMGRLAAGATVPQAQASVAAAATAMAHEWPDTHRGRGARFKLLGDGNSELRGIRVASGIALGIIGLVLLLACFNVANLLLARAVERERDMGVRAALGARPSRLVRLVLAEGILLSALAGAAALLLTRWTQSIVGSFALPIEVPQHVELSPDGTVVAYIALLVVVAGVLPGLWPALAASRLDVQRVLGSQGGHASGGRPSRLRRSLVAAQIAGSTVFLCVSALFVQSYGNLSVRDYGLDRDRVLIAELDPAARGYDAARSERYARAVAARALALPGVAAAALADQAPFFIGFNRMTAVSSGDAPCEGDGCAKYATLDVDPGYLGTLGVGLMAGRDFTAASPSEAIVNEPLARQLWPAGDRLGETLRIGQGDHARVLTVIGITAPTHTRGLDREQPTLYLPMTREAFARPVSLVLRAEGAPERLVRPLQEAALAVDPEVARPSVHTMAERMAVQLWPYRTLSWLFSICGALALILATAGLAGVVMHAVSRRRREFGVRMSMGATPRDLARDVLRGSMALLLPGLAAGTLLALAAGRLVRVALWSVNPLDPTTYLAVALLECAIVVAASVGPALRASRVDPLIALRSE